jgi:hypothetical protein
VSANPIRPSFGDIVRIRRTIETEAAGLAGLAGIVHGETVPSASGVIDVIGVSSEDAALYVHFEARGDGHWFAPDLVAFIDHAAGSEARIQGADVRWVRQASGEWREVSDDPPQASERVGFVRWFGRTFFKRFGR